ncbi:MAG: discoidin domain-containing protein [Bacteroidota bacterium]|nr:discoidin domain-containing protein [Bacteroidota bacterium]
MKKNTLKIGFAILSALIVFSCTKDESSFIDGLPDAVINNDPDDAPARVMQESWNGHSDTIYREYFDNDVAVFFDEDVNRDIVWVRQFSGDVWEYIQNNYGGFDNDKRLWTIFHSDQVEPYYTTIFDDSSMNNSLIDLSLSGEEMNSEEMDLILTLVSEIVQNSAFNTANSPVSAVWKDNFADIFLYDVYSNLGMEDEAQRIMSRALETSSDYPTADSFWFRDWFLPIYENYEGVITLNNFFQSLSMNFSKNGSEYARDLTFGEFVHFFSGAVGEDIQPFAEEAFGEWTDEWQTELLQARTDFPNVNYPFEPTSKLVDLTLNATLHVSKDNNGGAQAGEGSLKVIDNDINSKFLISDFSSDLNFWMEQEFAQEQVVNRYTLTSGNDAPDRDPKSWELRASNDGENWEVLDTRTEESFPDRNQTREFTVENDKAYKYYRLYITENYGSNLLQISEWRLLSLQLIDSSQPADVTTNATLTVSRENNDGADAGEGSSKLIDNDIYTKFLAEYDTDFFMQQQLSEPAVVSKYAITSGNDAPDRDPVNWELSGSNDGVTWDVLDTRNDQSFDGRNLTREFGVNNSTAYEYYRLSVTSNNGSNVIQISEWRLYGQVGSVGPQDFTDAATLTVNHDNAGGADAGEGSLKLVDGDIYTKFLTGFSSDLWMQQELPQAQVVNAYTITSGNDAPDRDLKDWEFAGSNDGSNWDVLDTRTGETWSGRNETRQFEINNTTAYTYYRITMTANNGSDGTQVSEWRLLKI